RMLMRLERYVRVDFQRGKVITPLLDEAEMQRVRRTLQLTLEQAQWAVLRSEGEVYRVSIERAADMLEQFFEMDNPQVQAMRNRLNQLAGERGTLVPPDLAPRQRSPAAYRQRRQHRARAAGAGESSEGEELDRGTGGSADRRPARDGGGRGPRLPADCLGQRVGGNQHLG